MPCSPEKREAARRNGARSRGPITPEGKAISRANSLKHGLTGQGIVLPQEDAQEVERRLSALEEEIRPRNEIEAELARRVAIAGIRLGRAAEHESAIISSRMDSAIAEHDEARLADVDHLVSWIAKEPATHARRLRATPEGLERLIKELEGLRSALVHPGGCRWDFHHADHLAHLLGVRYNDVPTHRVRALTEASEGNFKDLDDSDRPDLDRQTRKEWALHQLLPLMEAEIAAVKARLEAFDRTKLERERAGTPARAMFDGSKDGILARKYEAANERSLFRAIRELRELRAAEPQVDEEEDVTPDEPEELGSFLPATSGDDHAKPDADPTPIRRRPDLEKLARKARRRRDLR